MKFQYEVIGGLLIGLASVLPLLFEGRIAGVSGYAASAMRPKGKDGPTSLIFVLGLLIGGFIWKLLGGAMPDIQSIGLSPFVWAMAGLLVGFGSRLGGGCTSGHGVCGMGRMSPRSFVSVVIFMFMAIFTTFLMRTLL